jgi:hypothetical protein
MSGTIKMDTLVRFLFGHEQAVFSNGRFGFDVRPGALLLVLIFLLAAVFVYFIYLRPRFRLSKGTTARRTAGSHDRVAVATGRGRVFSNSAQQLRRRTRGRFAEHETARCCK